MEYSLQFLGSDPFMNDIVQMVRHAGPMVKFVLLLLFFFSLYSWTIIFMKFRLLRKCRDENDMFLEVFTSSREIGKVYLEAKNFKFSPLAQILRAGYAELNRSRNIHGNPDEDNVSLDQKPIMDNVQRAFRSVLSNQRSRLQRGLTFLATTGNTAPFIGLFGTVWGIMTSFRSIGLKGSASLAVVAPGIAEALIATAAGLAAAIPAVVAFNYFTRKVRVFETEMGTFISDLTGMLGRGLIRMASTERAKGR